MPANWSPPARIVVPSLFGVALLALAPWRPLIGLMVFVFVGYGFPRRQSFEFFCRWHVLEAIALLSFLALLVSRFIAIDSALARRSKDHDWRTGLRAYLDRQLTGSTARHPITRLMFALVIWVVATAAVAAATGDYQPASNHHPVHMIDGLLLMLVAAECLRSRAQWWWFVMTVAVTLCLRIAFAPQYLHLNGDLGILLAMGALLSILGIVVAGRWPLAALAAATAAIQLFALYRTENRGGLVAFAAATVVVWLCSRWKWRWLAIAVPVVVIAGPYFLETNSWKRMESIWKGGPDRLTVDSRFVIYQAGLKMALNNPVVGVGLGNFESQMAKYSRNGKANSPHNNVVGMFAETGFLGGCVYVALFGYGIVSCILLSRRICDQRSRWLAALLGATLVAYMTGGMFMTRHTFCLAYLLLGGVIAVSALLDGVPDEESCFS